MWNHRKGKSRYHIKNTLILAHSSDIPFVSVMLSFDKLFPPKLSLIGQLYGLCGQTNVPHKL